MKIGLSVVSSVLILAGTTLATPQVQTSSNTAPPPIEGPAVYQGTIGAPVQSMVGTSHGGQIGPAGANTVAVISTTSITGSIEQVLIDLGVSADFFSGSDFSGIDLTPYNDVIVGMDGGAIEDPSIANLEAFANAGGNLIMIGGTCWQPFADAVNARLLDIDESDWCWTQNTTPPDMTVTDPGHPLAKNLPPTYDYVDNGATFYTIRNQDASSSVAAVNGDGFDCLLSRALGAGVLNYFISSASDLYWSDAADYAILKTVIENALFGAEIMVISTTSVAGSIDAALNNLGYAFDSFSGSDFSGVDLSGYKSVIVGMDGGLIEDPSIANLEAFVEAGGELLMVGGTCYEPFALSVDARLLDIDEVNYCWTTDSGAPNLTITNSSRRLAQGLPGTYNYVNLSATFYMIRNQDGAANVSGVNGDGFDCLFSKPVGAGRLNWFISSAQDSYWADAGDLAILQQIIDNAVCNGDVPGSASNYGAGWPGTSGVPSLTVDQPGAIGRNVTLQVGNSAGVFTTGFLIIGFAPASLGTGLGGTLLVLPSSIFSIPIPSGGVDLVGEVPDDVALIGFAVYHQILMNDGGASNGVSFTEGLELIYGDC